MRIEDYKQVNLNVAALSRAAAGVELSPGQDVGYVVVNDDARRQERARMYFEDIDRTMLDS